MSTGDRIRALAAEIAPRAVELRRDIHRHPEIGWNEHRTTQAVVDALAASGVEAAARESGTGLIVDVGEKGPLVGFRADLDALPLQEANEVPYASTVPGLMHACGHDAHTAIGVGVTTVLSRLELPGRVRVIFQPAEEQIPGGAMTLRQEGAIDGVRSIFAFHVDPTLPAGQVGLRVGAITGASDRAVIRLLGPGGHTSRPHQSVDLVYASARVVTDLPALLRHEIDPRQTVVAVFGRVSGGSAANVIPTEVELAGTLRMFDVDLWHEMPQMVEKLVQAIVAPLGAVATVEYTRGSPPVVNDEGVIEAARRAATAMLGRDSARIAHQSLGAEDFSWFLEAIPGALVRLGSALTDHKTDLHSATFDLDERAIGAGIQMGAAIAFELLEHGSVGE